MLRKITAVLLIFLLIFSSLTGCAGLSSKEETASSDSSETESEETSEEKEDRSSDDDADTDSEKETASEQIPFYSDTGELLCSISFTADQTQFFIGDEGIVNLTVSFPQDLFENIPEEGVRIVNEADSEIGTFAPEEFSLTETGEYTASSAFQMETQTNRTFPLKAWCGDYYSPWLVLTVTPEITADQIADCAVIGSELNEAMVADYADASAEDRAKAAKEWLEKDERILSTDLTEGDVIVYYTTADYVAGAFNAAGVDVPDDPRQMYSGINDGSSSDYMDNGTLTELYNEYGLDQIEESNEKYYDATENSTVATNPNALLLIPCPEFMGNLREDYIEDLSKDVSDYAEITGGTATILTGTDAIGAILGQKMNEYGLVTLFTHGTTNHNQIFRDNNKQTLYLMYRSEPFTDETKESIHQDVESKLNEYAQTAYQTDVQGKNSEKSFYSTWYGEPNIFSLVKYSKQMIIATEFNEDHNMYEIWMTNGFIKDRYQDQRFDNTVFYIGACKGLLDIDFDEWLLNHGCRYVFGFTVKVRTIANVVYHRLLLVMMTETVTEHPNRFRVVQEATEEVGVLNPADWNLDSPEVDPPVWFDWIGPLSNSYRAQVPNGLSNNTLYYVGQNDFLFKGTGTLKGHVKCQEIDSDGVPLDSEPEPAAGATVRAYLLRNRTFTAFPGNEVIADENGDFVIPDCPMGYLILTAEKDGSSSKPYQICFIDDEKDGGDLLIPMQQQEQYGLVSSACLDQYRSKIYSLRPGESGLEALPFSAAKYDYICSFAFYNGKVYYCCKESGTSDYYMALYEANLDGSGQRELYAPSEFNYSLNHFVLKDGFLYFTKGYWAGSTWIDDYHQIDLITGSVAPVGNPPADVMKALAETSGYFERNGNRFYTAGGSLPRTPLQIVWEKEDGSTETLVNGNVSIRLEGVFSTGIPGDYDLYYSTFTADGQTAGLYRMNLVTRETELLDSHMAVGGGIYFNW